MISKKFLPLPGRNTGKERTTEILSPSAGIPVMISGQSPDSPFPEGGFSGNAFSDTPHAMGRMRESDFFAEDGNSFRLYRKPDLPATDITFPAGIAIPRSRGWLSEIRFREYGGSRRKKIRGVQSLLGNPLPAWKRAMDIAGSAFGLAVLSPVFFATAVLIKIVSPGPVFYSQKRVGYRGKLFDIWKFRTMHVNANTELHKEHVREFIQNNPDAAMVKIGNDPRIIPFGKALRKTAIDELPQLFNVLRGDMSLVGPRPELPYAAQNYEPWPTQRFDVVPGMTGLWQVSGKNKTTYHEMMRLDIRYTLKRTFLLDMKILLKTFPVLIAQVAERSKGA